MEFLRRAAEYVRRMFTNMTAVQKVAVLTLVVLVLGAIVWGATSVTRDGWVRIVGTETSREERGVVIKKLTEKNVKYEIRDEEIYVPKEVADQTVIELHSEGVISDAQLWAFLDEPAITVSKWQQERRYQVAIQRKLERMILSIKTVQRASVQLTPGDQAHVFGFKGAEPAASVTVEMKAGNELTRANVTAIARLVANSQTGLKPHRVLIMDSRGMPYRVPEVNGDWDLAESRLDMEKQYAKYYEEQIKKQFADALPAVFMELSSETQRKIEEKFGPAVPVMKEKRSEIDNSNPRVGAPGERSEGDLKGGDRGLGMSREYAMDESRQEIRVPREYIESDIRAGIVKGKAVSVVFPVFFNEGENPEDAVKKEQVKTVAYQNAIMRTVGLSDPSLVSVTYMPTRKPGMIPPPSFREKAEELLERYGGTLILFLLAIVALIIVYKLLKAALPKGVVEDIEALRARLAEETAVPGAPEMALAEEEINRLKMSVREMVTKNPRSVAAIVRRWLTGK